MGEVSETGSQHSSPCLTGMSTRVLLFDHTEVDDGPTGLQDRLGALFFACVCAVFVHISSAFGLISDFRLFLQERAKGYYRTESYFLARWAADTVLVRILPMVIFASISYWMVGLAPEFDKVI